MIYIFNHREWNYTYEKFDDAHCILVIIISDLFQIKYCIVYDRIKYHLLLKVQFIFEIWLIKNVVYSY